MGLSASVLTQLKHEILEGHRAINQRLDKIERLLFAKNPATNVGVSLHFKQLVDKEDFKELKMSLSKPNEKMFLVKHTFFEVFLSNYNPVQFCSD